MATRSTTASQMDRVVRSMLARRQGMRGARPRGAMLFHRSAFLLVFAPLALVSACSTEPAQEDDGTPPAPTPARPSPEPDPESAPPTSAPAGENGARPYEHVDISHVISTGQSNSVANDATTILSKVQPYSNLMFDTGVMTAGGCDREICTSYQKPSRFVPLVEGDSFFADPHPVETMSSGLANEATKLAKERHGEPAHDVLVSLHGRSGYAYLCLRKGGCNWWDDRDYVKAFDDGMMQVTDAFALAKAAGKSYAVRAVTAIHGEHEHYSNTGGYSYFPMTSTDGSARMVEHYGEGLEEWQRDYESSVKAITGQTVPVPLLISQYSHWNDAPHTEVAFLQLEAHVRSKGKVVIVGPTYALPYSDDCLHFLSDGERWLGEYFAKAYTRIVVEGRDWEPVRPTSASLAGNVITVKYHVPTPPLVIDTQRVTEAPSYGFELDDASGAPPAITSVELAGPDTVKITLASAPAAKARLRYAYTFTSCMDGRTSARGNIRDSDTTPSQAGYELFNWSVHFDTAL